MKNSKIVLILGLILVKIGAVQISLADFKKMEVVFEGSVVKVEYLAVCPFSGRILSVCGAKNIAIRKIDLIGNGEAMILGKVFNHKRECTNLIGKIVSVVDGDKVGICEDFFFDVNFLILTKICIKNRIFGWDDVVEIVGNEIFVKSDRQKSFLGKFAKKAEGFFGFLGGKVSEPAVCSKK